MDERTRLLEEVQFIIWEAEHRGFPLDRHHQSVIDRAKAVVAEFARREMDRPS